VSQNRPAQVRVSGGLVLIILALLCCWIAFNVLRLQHSRERLDLDRLRLDLETRQFEVDHETVRQRPMLRHLPPYAR
jgi:hypothetical protein